MKRVEPFPTISSLALCFGFDAFVAAVTLIYSEPDFAGLPGI